MGERGAGQNICKKCQYLLWMVPSLSFLMMSGISLLCMGVNDKIPMETKIDFIKMLNTELCTAESKIQTY